MEQRLVSRDSKGKLRIVILNCFEEEGIYYITRQSGLVGGSMVVHPTITVSEGKAKRTVAQQADLVFNSKLNSYLDKGYKCYLSTMSDNQLEDFVPMVKTDSNGNVKPMLAKIIDRTKPDKFKTSRWFASRKIDGVRCLMYYKDGQILTVSRGGKDYNEATEHIRTDAKLLSYFKINPDVILDGELYIPGYSLQMISGMCRNKKGKRKTTDLQYFIYDMMILDTTFKYRLQKLQEFEKFTGCGNIENPGKELFIIVPHVLITDYSHMQILHDKWVKEGYEGLVARLESANYSPGARTSDMVKMKEYTDGEFLITGIAEGLRDEDLCFTCITDDGKTFKAKPIGSRELKEEYRENLDQIVGKMATVKYFSFSDEGIPTQPVLKCIRDYE